ncbi:hypothetical protein L195_g026930 [Trifolium pratense]|uniref:Uncharacterized protein n=1 Tax=Trifolium pratense TaxID=57577 RepID=A0A2K3KXQ2_TRIPR|nr:hypothetical protein L195_g026930 [Trifolium pratense]
MSSSSSSTDLPSVSVSESNKATSSYLSFTSFPDTVFPDGNNGSANWY